MKNINLFLLVLMSALLIGCHTKYNSFRYNSTDELITENWVSKVVVDPAKLVKNPDRWYFTGDPRPANVPAVSMQVPQFNKVIIDGTFNVHMTGEQPKSSIVIVGPRYAANQVIVEYDKDTVYIHQAVIDDKGNINNIKNVTVEIGIKNLRSLRTNGTGVITGRHIFSDSLVIDACSAGPTILGGNIRLVRVNQSGPGTLTVYSVNSNNLNVYVNGDGNLNLSGDKINIKNIEHNGNGNLRIVGADSKWLTIHARGNGLTTLAGCANIKEITAQDCSEVYAYWVQSDTLNVTMKDASRVALAGTANDLYLITYDTALFGGQYLRTENAYVRTYSNSHANVLSYNKLFAQSSDKSSIYFFGAPNRVEKFTSGDGAVYSGTTPLPMPPIVLDHQPLTQKGYKPY